MSLPVGLDVYWVKGKMLRTNVQGSREVAKDDKTMRTETRGREGAMSLLHFLDCPWQFSSQREVSSIMRTYWALETLEIDDREGRSTNNECRSLQEPGRTNVTSTLSTSENVQKATGILK